MPDRNLSDLLMQVERRLRDAEVDYLWTLHEDDEPGQVARSAGKLAALRYAHERLLDEVAVQGYLAEMAYLVACAASTIAPDAPRDPGRRPGRTSSLIDSAEFGCTYRIAGLHPHRRN
jgi:hypothetical protein